MPSEKKTTSSTHTDERVRELLLWLRRERIVCTEVTVGDITLTVNDMVLAASLVGPPPTSKESMDAATDDAGRRNLYAQYGGTAIDEVAKEEATTYEDDD